MSEFLKEVIDYNSLLRQEGYVVVIGDQHGDDNMMHFVYTSEAGEQKHLQIPFEPTDYTQWQELKEWAGIT